MITGATGYIGTHLAAAAKSRGHRLTFLARTPDFDKDQPGVCQFKWIFGEPPPAKAFAQNGEYGPVDSLIHLAHQWQSSRPEPEDENLTGTSLLLQAARTAGISRIVYGSTVSARQNALNRYGRIKWAIEQLLESPSEVSARIGLVYGGREMSQWGVLSDMVRQAPVLPVPGASTMIQPIHIDDVCTGLLALAEGPAHEKMVYGLAAADSISFGRFLQQVAQHRHGRKLSVVPVPIWMALMGAELTKLLPFIPTVDRERILGVASIQTIETEADIRELGILPDDLAKNLTAEVTSI